MWKINSNVGEVVIDGYPNKCPFCHNLITPFPHYGHKRDRIVEVLLVCPNQDCKKGFIGYYHEHMGYWRFNGHVTQGNLVGKTFSLKLNH